MDLLSPTLVALVVIAIGSVDMAQLKKAFTG